MMIDMTNTQKLTRGLFLSLTILFTGCAVTNVGNKLEEYGYSELRPPSNLSPPGTLIIVKDTAPYIVGIICSQANALGQSINGHVLSSSSSTSTAARDLTGTFKLDAQYLSRIKASINATNIESITMSLANVKVLELPDDAVIEGLRDRTPSCSEAVRLRQSQGARISMVKSVISADVTYTVNYNSNLSAEAKAEITKKIAAELGGGSSSSGTESVSGANLFWGLRDDVELGSLLPNTLPSTGSGLRNRLIPANAAINIKD